MMLLLLPCSASAQVFNCTAFASSGTCGVSLIGGSGQNFAIVGTQNNITPVLSGSEINLAPTGADHVALSVNYQTAVNVQAFTASFKWKPNGQYMSFVLNNNTNTNAGGTGAGFSSGAGGERGIFQGFGTLPPSPNKIFAISFSSYDPLTNGGSFSYSSAQIYQMNQAPFLPVSTEDIPTWPTNTISTSPVPLNSPATTRNTSTGDQYLATITYDGSSLSLDLSDVTAGGSHFTQTWANIDIPALVGSNTAFAGLTVSTGVASSYPLLIDSFGYTVGSAPASPVLSTYTTSSNSGATPVAGNPTFSPAAGSYSGTQSVALSSTGSGAYVCYKTGTSIPAILPWPDSFGGCLNGTLYSGPISVAASETIYAAAGTTYTGLPSNMTSAAYTISGSTAPTSIGGSVKFGGKASIK